MGKQWKNGLAVLLALMLPWAAVAQATQTQTLQGLITEVGDGYFFLADETYGEVRVNLEDTVTAYEGIAAKDTLTLGWYVYVQYNGVMTRSLPPQVTATRVGCYVVRGTVSEILANGFLLDGDEVLGKVIVHLGEEFPPVYRGVAITVYYGGVMALSMPPQISAAHVEVPVLQGTVSDRRDADFTLTDAAGKAYRIAITADTLLRAMPDEGVAVLAYYSGELAGDTATALEIAPVADDRAQK